MTDTRAILVTSTVAPGPGIVLERRSAGGEVCLVASLGIWLLWRGFGRVSPGEHATFSQGGGFGGVQVRSALCRDVLHVGSDWRRG